MSEVYLLWESYKTNELMPIGVLRQIDERFSFQYFHTAKEASEQGCFLPFPYVEDVLYFDTLPDFFEQRILKGEFNNHKFDLIKDNNKLNYLIYRDSVKNNDNFRIVSEEKYHKLF